MSHNISPGQFGCLLVGCRLSLALLNVGNEGFWTTMAFLLSGTIITALVAVPLTLAGPPLWNSMWTQAICGIVLLWTSALSIQALGEFYRLGVYPRSESWIMILCLSVACAYGASLGLEALARFALPTLSAGLILLGLLSLMETSLSIFSLPPVDWQLSAMFFAFPLYPELAIYLLCLPRIAVQSRGQSEAQSSAQKKKGLWVLTWWLLASAALWVWCTLLGSADLNAGQEALRPYRLFTLSAMTGLSPWGRHDLLYLAALTFSGLMRIGVCLYGSAVGLGHLFPRISLSLRSLAAAALCLILACTDMTQRIPSYTFITITLAALGVLAGLWTLWSTWEQKRQKEAGRTFLSTAEKISPKKADP